jgi:hypothetical protein
MNSVYLEKTDIGATLATWIYCSMQMLYYADNIGLKGYISWPPNRSLQPHQDQAAWARCPNMYEWWFKQPYFDSAPPRGETWIAELAGVGPRNLFFQPLDAIKQYYRDHVVFNAEVKSRVDMAAVKYGNLDRAIGVSWRGCDSTDDGRPRLPIEVYYPFIDDILAEDPGLKILATAEEATVVDKLKARYPQTVAIDEAFSAPWEYRKHSEYVNPASGYERGVQTCLMVGLLSQCKYYVKNRSSMSSWAAWLSRGKIINLAHPENLGFNFDLTKAEIDGKLVPLYR